MYIVKVGNRKKQTNKQREYYPTQEVAIRLDSNILSHSIKVCLESVRIIRVLFLPLLSCYNFYHTFRYLYYEHGIANAIVFCSLLRWNFQICKILTIGKAPHELTSEI